MRIPIWLRLSAIDSNNNRPSSRLILCLMLAATLSASAQDVVPSPPAPSAPPPELQPTASAGGLTDTAFAPIQWGPVAIRPHARYSLTRNDGVQAQPGLKTDTTVNTVSAGLGFTLGSHWSADYTPTWTMYSSRLFTNSVDHSAMLNGSVGFTDGTLGLRQTFSISDSPRIETGRQTHQQTVSTTLSGSYALGQRTRLSVSLSRDNRSVESSPDSTEWSAQNWFHYQFSNRLDAAVGVGLGYVTIDPGTDMSYIRPQARIGWRPTEKLSFDVHGGSDQRRFRTTPGEKMSSPNYGASAYYQPLKTTTLSVTGDRGITPSFFAGQVNESTSWSVGLNQRLLQKFNFNATASRRNTDYLSVGAGGVAIAREDTSNSYTLRLGTSFLRRGSIGIFFQNTRNRSDESIYRFSSNQVGLEVGYSY